MEMHDIGEQGSNARLNVLSDIYAVTLAIFHHISSYNNANIRLIWRI
jgi:hypothetical protein